MTKATPMTDDELRALTDSEMRQAIGYWGGKLSEQRRRAEYYYLGLAKGDLTPPEVDGRSSFVSTDVRNTIESMLPQLMVKFVGSDSVVEFEPTKPGDEQKADMCTQYMNYLFFKKNNGHAITYNWFKDALLQKRGIIKVWWDTRGEERREEYKGLNDIELAQILEDPEVEPIEQNTYPDEEAAKQREQLLEQLNGQLMQAQQAMQAGAPQALQATMQIQAQIDAINQQPQKLLYDVAFRRKLQVGKVTIENVPPEEFLISRKAKDLNSASFVGHRVMRTMSELRSMGYKNLDNLGTDDGAAMLNAERIERLSFDDEQAYINVENLTTDESQRTIWVTECYIRCDYDGDGISELRKVVRAGNQILDNEEVDGHPFISICPIPMPHKFFGLSIADVAMESQKYRTQLLRAQIDNTNLQVNGRYFAVEDQVNLDDLLTSRPGGIVRVKNPNAVGRLDQGTMDLSATSNLMEWMEQFLENSTGWTRYSQGNDGKGLNDTATGVVTITNRGDMRTDLIARHFAEGFVELFRLMLKLTSQNVNRKQVVRLTGGWQELDPREWRNQFDVNINVGIGMGDRDQQVQRLMALQATQAKGLQIGIATPKNLYESSTELAKALGYKSGDRFFNDPSKNPPPPQPNPIQMQAQAQMQIEGIKAQSAERIKQMELGYQAQADQAKRNYEAQLEQVKASYQAQVDNNRQASEAEQHRMKMENEAQLAALKAQYADQAHMREMDFNRWKAELEASVRIEVANISSRDKVVNPAVDAATSEIAREVRP